MTNTTNLFEKATVGKYRYQFKGIITTEDLFDLSINQLDFIFKTLNSELKQSSEESLLQVKTSGDEELETKIAIIKYIVNQKVETQKAKAEEVQNREKREKILAIIESKQDEALQNLSVEELQKLI